MNELKFVNKIHTLEELKELLNIGDRKKYKLLNIGDRKKYKLIIYYDRTYTKKCFNGRPITSNFGDYETEYFYGYPDKYLDLPVLSCMVRNELTTILVYGGKRNG